MAFETGFWRFRAVRLPGGGRELGFGKRGRRGWREIKSLDDALEVHLLVGAVAEGLVCRVPAAAKANLVAAGEPKYLAVLIYDFEVSLDSYGTIGTNRNLGTCHAILRRKNGTKVPENGLSTWAPSGPLDQTKREYHLS